MEGQLSERRATQTSMLLVLATIGRKPWYAILRRNTTVVRTGVYPRIYDRNQHPFHGQTGQLRRLASNTITGGSVPSGSRPASTIPI